MSTVTFSNAPRTGAHGLRCEEQLWFAAWTSGFIALHARARGFRGGNAVSAPLLVDGFDASKLTWTISEQGGQLTVSASVVANWTTQTALSFVVPAATAAAWSDDDALTFTFHHDRARTSGDRQRIALYRNGALVGEAIGDADVPMQAHGTAATGRGTIVVAGAQGVAGGFGGADTLLGPWDAIVVRSDVPSGAAITAVPAPDAPGVLTVVTFDDLEPDFTPPGPSIHTTTGAGSAGATLWELRGVVGYAAGGSPPPPPPPPPPPAHRPRRDRVCAGNLLTLGGF